MAVEPPQRDCCVGSNSSRSNTGGEYVANCAENFIKGEVFWVRAEYFCSWQLLAALIGGKR